MGTMIALLPIFMQILSALPGLIQTAEVAFSGHPGTSGQAKKDLVMGVVQASTQAAGMDATHSSSLHNAAAGLIDTVVNIFNTVGLFTHHSAPATPTPPSHP